MRSIIASLITGFFMLIMASAASAASCNDNVPVSVQEVEVQTLTILPCPSNGNAIYVPGVPGQAELLKHGLIALQGKGPKGCLWIKTVKANNGTYTIMKKKVTTDLVAIPAAGVLRTDGSGVKFQSSAFIAGLELKPGACAGRTKGYSSVAELIALK